MAESMRREYASKQSLSCTLFHVARDPEFQEGLQHGRQAFPEQCDLREKEGWWNAEEVIQFIAAELSPESQAKINQVHQFLNVAPHTPVYHLGLVAGFLVCFAETATSGEVR